MPRKPAPLKNSTPAPDASKPQRPDTALAPMFSLANPDTRVYVGDSRDLLASVPECKAGEIDLLYADPPFNRTRDYDRHVEDSPWSRSPRRPSAGSRNPDASAPDPRSRPFITMTCFNWQ